LIEVGQDPLIQHRQLPGIQGAGVAGSTRPRPTCPRSGVGDSGQYRADQRDVCGADRMLSYRCRGGR
jgi:hypothetical protein